MKSIFKTSFFASLFLLSFISVNAQKSLNEAHIEYEVTEIKSESMEAQMMKGTLINVFFTPAKSKLNVQMMGGMVTMDILTETASEQTTMLMNMMGQKAKVKQPKEETDKAEKPEFDITYDKSDTKEIAGHKCTKATLTNKKTKESITIYTAKKLKPMVELLSDMFPGLEGLPLEIIINAEGMGVTITAQNFNKTVDANAFDIPADYPEMTPEEFQEKMGAMGGGFGF